MKTCPVCKTALFEDMPVCYGCMYEFGSRPELERQAVAEAELGTASDAGPAVAEGPWGLGVQDDAEGPSAGLGADSRPAFMRRDVAMLSEPAPSRLPEEAPWTIRLEMRSDDDPRTTWSMELLSAGRRAAAACQTQISSR